MFFTSESLKTEFYNSKHGNPIIYLEPTPKIVEYVVEKVSRVFDRGEF